jgi:diguanylate cyclase (GGDEF)-like protein/PAS domain S-box-containing protein
LAVGRDIEGFAFATLLESFVGLMRDACLAVAPDGRILTANDEAGRIYGRSLEDLAEMHADELAAPGRAGLMPHSADDVRMGVVFDSVHLRADCSRLPVRVSAKASDFCGREIILATVLEDCDYSDAEEERIKSAAFDAALDAIIVHDRDGNLLHFNKAAAEAARMTSEQFACIEPWGWIPPAGRPGIPSRLDAVLDSGSLIFEGTGLRADGTTYANEVHARGLTLTGRTVVVSVVRDISERRRAEAAIHALAYHDVLTGLPNRSLLSERAEQAMAEAARYGDLLGLAFIDLDEFKPINDDIGHHAGDSVLTTIAERLVSAVRSGDTVARFGGDEFVVMLPRLQNRSALERIGSKLAQVIRMPLEAEGRTIGVTASIGLAVYDPLEDGFSSLLSKADMAMYSAKRAGESWRVFNESMVLR